MIYYANAKPCGVINLGTKSQNCSQHVVKLVKSEN